MSQSLYLRISATTSILASLPVLAQLRMGVLALPTCQLNSNIRMPS